MSYQRDEKRAHAASGYAPIDALLEHIGASALAATAVAEQRAGFEDLNCPSLQLLADLHSDMFGPFRDRFGHYGPEVAHRLGACDRALAEVVRARDRVLAVSEGNRTALTLPAKRLREACSECVTEYFPARHELQSVV